RIDRLPPEERRVVQAAAVVGKDVPFALLEAIADVPGATLRRALSELQAAEVLREKRILPDVEYTFQHALTHDVADGVVTRYRRRALHARMVEALERAYGQRRAEVVERLASHAVAAELWPEALLYNREAGAKAARRSAHREAVAFFEQAIAAIGHLPESRATREETLDLYLQLRWSLVPLGADAKL